MLEVDEVAVVLTVGFSLISFNIATVLCVIAVKSLFVPVEDRIEEILGIFLVILEEDKVEEDLDGIVPVDGVEEAIVGLRRVLVRFLLVIAGAFNLGKRPLVERREEDDEEEDLEDVTTDGTVELVELFSEELAVFAVAATEDVLAERKDEVEVNVVVGLAFIYF